MARLLSQVGLTAPVSSSFDCLHTSMAANEREFSALQLYEPLTGLPKNINATRNPILNPMICDGPNSAEMDNVKGERSADATIRMRTRMALLARGLQEEPPVIRAKGEEIDVMDES